MKRKRLLAVISLIVIIATVLPLTACTNGLDDTKYAVISENNLSDDGLVYSQGEKQIHGTSLLSFHIQYDCAVSDGYVHNDLRCI